MRAARAIAPEREPEPNLLRSASWNEVRAFFVDRMKKIWNKGYDEA